MADALRTAPRQARTAAAVSVLPAAPPPPRSRGLAVRGGQVDHGHGRPLPGHSCPLPGHSCPGPGFGPCEQHRPDGDDRVAPGPPHPAPAGGDHDLVEPIVQGLPGLLVRSAGLYVGVGPVQARPGGLDQANLLYAPPRPSASFCASLAASPSPLHGRDHLLDRGRGGPGCGRGTVTVAVTVTVTGTGMGTGMGTVTVAVTGDGGGEHVVDPVPVDVDHGELDGEVQSRPPVRPEEGGAAPVLTVQVAEEAGHQPVLLLVLLLAPRSQGRVRPAASRRSQANHDVVPDPAHRILLLAHAAHH